MIDQSHLLTLAITVLIAGSGALFSAFGLAWTSNLFRLWNKLLTRDLPPAFAARRIEEMESELFEECQHWRELGHGPAAIAINILWRLARSVPGDLDWRARMREHYNLSLPTIIKMEQELLALRDGDKGALVNPSIETSKEAIALREELQSSHESPLQRLEKAMIWRRADRVHRRAEVTRRRAELVTEWLLEDRTRIDECVELFAELKRAHLGDPQELDDRES